MSTSRTPELQDRELLEEHLLLSEDLAVPPLEGLLEGVAVHQRRNHYDDPPALLQMVLGASQELRERAHPVRSSRPCLGQEPLLVHGEIRKVEDDRIEPPGHAGVHVRLHHVDPHAVAPGVPAREFDRFDVYVPGGDEAPLLREVDRHHAGAAPHFEDLLLGTHLQGLDEEYAVLRRRIHVVIRRYVHPGVVDHGKVLFTGFIRILCVSRRSRSSRCRGRIPSSPSRRGPRRNPRWCGP